MPLQPRLGSINTNREPVFLAAGDLRTDQGSLGSATEPQQNIGVVIQPPTRYKGAQVRTQGLNLVVGHELEQILGVATDIAHATTEARACRIRSPGGLLVTAG